MANKRRGGENRSKPARSGSKKVRYGMVGLGWFAQVAILPAFAHASRNSELVALFSDDPEKLRTLGRKYRIDPANQFGYDGYDAALRSGAIDAVYIALPNHLHREYTVRAARAGVHVLTEKPMAVTEKDCEAMIRACGGNGVQLMVAYRLHFEKANLEAVEIVQSGKLGEPRIYNSVFCNDVKDPDNIRLNPIEEGGGTLYDIGIYCLNAARYLFRSEPEEVFAISASNDDPRFRKADEMTTAVLKFPGERLATFTSSFGAASSHHYDVFGTKGHLRVEPAFEFAEGMSHRLTIGGKTREKKFEKRDQIAPEILTFSECIMTGREPEPSGREGLADVRVIRALYKSAKTGRSVTLPPFEKRQRPGRKQELLRPPGRPQELVHADAPSGEI
ncbi:MAG: Gfo/Idh/MocA family oxidoreductase [Acidobacteriota bacterium]